MCFQPLVSNYLEKVSLSNPPLCPFFGDFLTTSQTHRERRDNAFSAGPVAVPSSGTQGITRPTLGLHLANVARPTPLKVRCFVPHNGNASHRTHHRISHLVNAFKAQSAVFHCPLADLKFGLLKTQSATMSGHRRMHAYTGCILCTTQPFRIPYETFVQFVVNGMVI